MIVRGFVAAALLCACFTPGVSGAQELRLRGRSLASQARLLNITVEVIYTDVLPAGAPKPIFSNASTLADELSRPVQIPGDDSQTRVINGDPVRDMFRFPYMARLESEASPGADAFLCGGTLVSSNAVLTAGHCTDMRYSVSRFHRPCDCV